MSRKRAERSRTGRGDRLTLAVFWVATWVGCMLLWLLLTSTINASEAIAGFGAAAVAATAAEVVRIRARAEFRPRLRWFGRAWRLPAQIVTDTYRIFALLVGHLLGRRRVRGTWRAVPFEHGSRGPRGNARRALATVAVSMTPNAIVIGFDDANNEMLVHQLVADPDSVTTLVGRP